MKSFLFKIVLPDLRNQMFNSYFYIFHFLKIFDYFGCFDFLFSNTCNQNCSMNFDSFLLNQLINLKHIVYQLEVQQLVLFLQPRKCQPRLSCVPKTVISLYQETVHITGSAIPESNFQL